jgi:hypothetical protein
MRECCIQGKKKLSEDKKKFSALCHSPGCVVKFRTKEAVRDGINQKEKESCSDGVSRTVTLTVHDNTEPGENCNKCLIVSKIPSERYSVQLAEGILRTTGPRIIPPATSSQRPSAAAQTPKAAETARLIKHGKNIMRIWGIIAPVHYP